MIGRLALPGEFSVKLVCFILPFVEKHGKMEGCTQMTMTGRKGWEKGMSKIYKVESRVFLSTEI